MTTEFDLTDYGEMYWFAKQAKEAGTERVLIDPADAIALIEEVKRLQGLNTEIVNRGNELVGRINNALRILAGPSPMEEAVAGNRRALGLPPQCGLCGAAEDPDPDKA